MFCTTPAVALVAHALQNYGLINPSWRRKSMFKFATTKALIVGIALLLPASFALAASSSDRGGKLPKADADFIKDAAQGGMMEVELGKIAADKASNSQVKDFGKRMQQDHSKANDELKKLASDKGVQLSATLDKKHQSKVDKLAKLSGAEFDRKYIDAMVDDHKDDVKKFQKEADKGKDADIQKWASKTLPTLKEHLQLAQSTEKQVKASKKT
jgi:putative membrane protein